MHLDHALVLVGEQELDAPVLPGLEAGAILERIDVNQSNLTEEFFYDALNRLDYSQLNGVTNLDLTLDAIGNITSKTSSTDPAENIGTYSYDTTKKHAVVSTSNGWSFGYDANGNMNSYRGNSISWTSYNLPSTINGSGQSSQFWYGPNRNRWKQLASYPSSTETTIYVGGVLEKVTVASGTAYRHYIGAGSAQVIYTRSSTGAENTKYLTADHLNSSSVLMDASGNTLVGMSFAAYGARRGGAWIGAPSSGDWSQINNATRHGYTGHEHLDNMSLIHMNGRVFEPALGRFLSADPFMPGMLGSQAGNRLAYVGNQPLTLIDPSGFDAKEATETTPRKLPQCPYQIPGIEVDCPYQYGWRWDRDPFDLWFEREMLVEAWVRMMDATGGGANRQPPLPRPNPPSSPVNPPQDPGIAPPKARPEAAQRTCTFSEDVAYRRQRSLAERNGKITANAAVLSVEVAREIRIGSQIIDGKIHQPGFDGRARVFPVDTKAGARHLGSSGWVGAAGRVIVVYGAADSGLNLYEGYKYHDRDKVFQGSMGLGLLVVGAINPAAGIAGGLAYIVGDATSSDENEPLDLGFLLSPCDPAYRPRQQ